MVKKIKRFFGFCGHEFTWTKREPMNIIDVDGSKVTVYVSIGTCKRCNFQKFDYIEGV